MALAQAHRQRSASVARATQMGPLPQPNLTSPGSHRGGPVTAPSRSASASASHAAARYRAAMGNVVEEPSAEMRPSRSATISAINRARRSSLSANPTSPAAPAKPKRPDQQLIASLLSP